MNTQVSISHVQELDFSKIINQQLPQMRFL